MQKKTMSDEQLQDWWRNHREYEAEAERKAEKAHWRAMIDRRVRGWRICNPNATGWEVDVARFKIERYEKALIDFERNYSHMYTVRGFVDNDKYYDYLEWYLGGRGVEYARGF